MFKIKKLIFIVTFNISLFLILMIGIQNSSSKKKVNFIAANTIDLPVSFIVGISFITGTFAGSFLTLNINKE
tara:strand:- start:242 stop:457 length:216 start_codon:yes stop_codon:yes gene_type:complete